jgi:Fe-S-cluster containining protein
VPAILGFHAGYRCRDSGVCCTSGWAIPVEASVHRTLASALASANLRLPRDTPIAPFVVADLPPEYASLLGVHADGACAFYDAAHRRCAIHSSLGAHAKPVSCRAFPSITVVDPRGVSRSLSHYCPAAADLLVDEQPIYLTEVSAPQTGGDPIDGLDAREALPPELRDDALVDWDSLSAWDRFVVAVLDGATSPEAALDRLWAAYEQLREWRASAGPLVSLVEGLGTGGDGGPRTARTERERPLPAASLIAAVHASIPEHVRPAPLLATAPASIADGAGPEGTLDEVWSASSGVLCRYLAARAHACWPLYQGRGLRTQLVYLEAVLASVRAHAVDASRRTSLPLDRAGLRESIRRADLWLVHLASPEPLAHALDRLSS